MASVEKDRKDRNLASAFYYSAEEELSIIIGKYVSTLVHVAANTNSAAEGEVGLCRTGAQSWHWLFRGSMQPAFLWSPSITASITSLCLSSYALECLPLDFYLRFF